MGDIRKELGLFRKKLKVWSQVKLIISALFEMKEKLILTFQPKSQQ